MLLFMVQAEFDAALHGRVLAPQERLHRRVHVLAVAAHFRHRRARQRAAQRARELVADAVVVGVEEVLEGGVERPVAVRERLQQEGLEEPGRVRQMPARRAGIDDRLHHVVFGGQGFAQRFRLRAHGGVVQACPVGKGGGRRGHRVGHGDRRLGEPRFSGCRHPRAPTGCRRCGTARGAPTPRRDAAAAGTPRVRRSPASRAGAR